MSRFIKSNSSAVRNSMSLITARIRLLLMRGRRGGGDRARTCSGTYTQAGSLASLTPFIINARLLLSIRAAGSPPLHFLMRLYYREFSRVVY